MVGDASHDLEVLPKGQKRVFMFLRVIWFVLYDRKNINNCVRRYGVDTWDMIQWSVVLKLSYEMPEWGSSLVLHASVEVGLELRLGQSQSAGCLFPGVVGHDRDLSRTLHHLSGSLPKSFQIKMDSRYSPCIVGHSELSVTRLSLHHSTCNTGTLQTVFFRLHVPYIVHTVPTFSKHF